MKNGKKPTRRQKELLQELNFKADDWLVVKDTSNEMHIYNKLTEKVCIVRDGKMECVAV